MTENRSKIDPLALPTAFGDANGVASVLGAFPEAFGTSLGCPGDAFGQLLAAFGSSGAPQDKLWGSILASKSRPERLRTRPRSGPKRPKRLKIDFSSIWCRFGMDFRACSNDLPSIFARAACDEGKKAESQKGDAGSSAHVLALALCNRFVLLARLSKWHANIACSAFFRCVPTSSPSLH